jgi:hypothetical protein
MLFPYVLEMLSLLALIHQLQKLFLVAVSYIEVMCPSAQLWLSVENNDTQTQQMSNLCLHPHPKMCVICVHSAVLC